MISAEEIAAELGVGGKTLRKFLRDDDSGFARSPAEAHQRWTFSRAEADEVKLRFREQERRRVVSAVLKS